MQKDEIKETLDELKIYCEESAKIYDNDTHLQNLKFRDRMHRFANACSEAIKLID